MNISFYAKLIKVYLGYRFRRYIPVFVNLLITTKCNLRCSYCEIWRHSSELKLEHIFGLIDDLQRIGVPGLTISGGEPLLYPGFEKIGKYARKKGIITTISTNGTLINRENAKKLAENFDMIKISMEGIEKTNDKIRGKSGAFKKTMKGIELLENARKVLTVRPFRIRSLRIRSPRARPKIMIHIVANQNNKDELEKLVAMLKNKADSITIMPELADKKVFTDDSFVKTWKGLKEDLADVDEMITKPDFRKGKANCDAAKLFYFINPAGRVRPCNLRRDVVLGNINDERFYDIWRRGLSFVDHANISSCNGCYDRCTEVSLIIRKNPWQILKALPKLLKTYKF